MLAAALLSNKIKILRVEFVMYLVAILSSISTIIFAFCTQGWSLSITHGFMGFFGYILFIRISARISELSKNENIGRSKLFLSVSMAISAAVMCLSPTIISLEYTASYFLFWGSLMLFASIMLYCWRAIGEKIITAKN